MNELQTKEECIILGEILNNIANKQKYYLFPGLSKIF